MDSSCRTNSSAWRTRQSMSIAIIAWSRNSRGLSGAVASSSRRPCSGVSQFPRRTPIRRTPFTRRIPAASSGLRSPASAASYAMRRTAASRRDVSARADRQSVWTNRAGRTPTCAPWLRRPVLYPTELRAPTPISLRSARPETRPKPETETKHQDGRRRPKTGDRRSSLPPLWKTCRESSAHGAGAQERRPQ